MDGALALPSMIKALRQCAVDVKSHPTDASKYAIYNKKDAIIVKLPIRVTLPVFQMICDRMGLDRFETWCLYQDIEQERTKTKKPN